MIADNAAHSSARLCSFAQGPYRLATATFLRLVGATFLIAFGSLREQLEGLIGSRGISPAAEFLPWVHQQLGWRAYGQVPTLCWISTSDGFLHGLCAAGLALSALAMLGIAQRWSLLALWVLYLSLVSVGDVFLQYQWDSLLLETGFLSIFLASPRLGPSRATRVNPLALWLLRWLLFRLMFLSGVVKLVSGDPAWRDLTALRFHYWTQPLPTWTSYYLHLLPDALQIASAAAMFAIELVVPFLVFGPRKVRLFAAGAIALFQLAIFATGNYGFFNLLTLALCLLLVDDAAFSKILRHSIALIEEQVGEPARRRRRLRIAFGIASALFVLVSIAEMRFWRLPAPIDDLLRPLHPFRSINSYGLFAVMTTNRPEILVAGSDDGRSWREYEFKWKPGDPKSAPRFVAPHQPRLDWQMWFAALGSCARNPWFIRFQQRLLEGSPQVIRLLATNPFPQAPPRYIRSMVYEYRFASWADHRRAGTIWDRTRVGPYCPILSLHNGRLISVSSRSLEEQ